MPRAGRRRTAVFTGKSKNKVAEQGGGALNGRESERIMKGEKRYFPETRKSGVLSTHG